jgi:hypothetical protein
MITAKEYVGPDGNSIAIGPDLATVFDYSADLCAKRSMSRSYTSILLCLRVAPDELSTRFHAFVTPPTLEKIALRGQFSLVDVLQLPYCRQEDLAQKFSTWGANLIPIIANANAIANQVSSQNVIEVRHIMAAYIYDSSKKNQETLKTWGLDPQLWAEWFQKQMSDVCPHEAENWRLLHKNCGHPDTLSQSAEHF